VFEADLRPLTDAALVPLSRAAEHLPPGPCLLVGTGAELLKDEDARRIAADADPLPSAEVVALHAPVEPLPGEPPEPLYLRPPDAKPQKPLISRPN